MKRRSKRYLFPTLLGALMLFVATGVWGTQVYPEGDTGSGQCGDLFNHGAIYTDGSYVTYHHSDLALISGLATTGEAYGVTNVHAYNVADSWDEQMQDGVQVHVKCPA